jgi:hypothetical protein
MKKLSVLISLLLCAGIVLCLASCGSSGTEDETTTNYSYIPQGFEATTQGDAATPGDTINVDKSWQRNFSAEYEYYNPEQSPVTMKIREKKSQNAFTVEYVDTKSILYYKADGNNTDYYVIIDNQEQQAHSVLENKPFSTLSSMFMKLTELDKNLPSQSNVLYMYDEEVAGRPCHKYIQRAYSDGKLTQSVYVWIHKEYGFAAKCEAYDKDNTLSVMWRLNSFETGKLTDTDVFIDISQYNFEAATGETFG